MGKSAVSRKRIDSRRREERALELRRQGRRYDEIARELSVSNASAAWKMVMRAYERLNRRIDEQAEFNRNLDLQRLDAALAAIWQKVINGQMGAIDRLLPILERRARLLGLDVPARQRVDVGDVLADIIQRLAESGSDNPDSG